MSLSRHESANVVPETRPVVSFDGTRILYDLYPATSRHAVLVVPGFWRSRRWGSMFQLAGFLNRLGFSAAIVDVRGHGDSEGTYGFNLNEERDVHSVALDLMGRLELDSISVIGFSVGAAIAASAVARHPELPWSSLVLVSPVAKFAMIRPRLNPFTMHRHLSASNALRPPRFTWRFLTSSKRCAVDDISQVHVPVCLVHVKDDWLVDHSHSMILYERCNEPRELHIIDIPGRYHADRILSVARDRIEPLIAEFLGRSR